MLKILGINFPLPADAVRNQHKGRIMRFTGHHLTGNDCRHTRGIFRVNKIYPGHTRHAAKNPPEVILDYREIHRSLHHITGLEYSTGDSDAKTPSAHAATPLC